MQPGGPRLLAKHPCRKDSSTGGGELGQRGRSGGGGDGRRGEASGVVTRALLVLGSLLCVFKMCTFLGADFSCFTRFISLVLSQCAQFVGGVGRGCCHRARPSGWGGRQELDKIVCGHSLYRLNASMIEQKIIIVLTPVQRGFLLSRLSPRQNAEGSAEGDADGDAEITSHNFLILRTDDSLTPP